MDKCPNCGQLTVNKIKNIIDVEKVLSQLNFDFGSLNKYNIEFVREVLKSVNDIGVNKTSIKYNINKSVIRSWRYPGRNSRYLKKHYHQKIQEKRDAKKDNYYKNPKHFINIQNKHNIKKYHKDPQFKLKCLLRTRIWKVLKEQNVIKDKHSEELVGCSIEQLKEHIEKQFQLNMTWDNYGQWHIDHIIPCSSFDLTKEDEQKKCFHYTNLQPLWAKDNLKKSNKILE